ncbi:MAG TPA: bifunctional phosphoglucose/phosphomannose isomerase, partial [Bacteroidetes bacterium]|nr:bifunctional phosphoglucose/phosphomannose isomerase [Bacteroidota bacterium]
GSVVLLLGYRPLIQMLYSVNLVDWISYYLAEQSGTDAMEIKNIDYLKNELSKI